MLKSFRQTYHRFSNSRPSYRPREPFLTSLGRYIKFLEVKILTLFPRFILPILVGIGIALLAIVATESSTKWVGVIVIAVVAPSVALIINDLKKIILIAIVVDIALGIDIAIQNQGWHIGGPTGYMVSLVTLVLIIGYALWIIEKKPKPFFPLIIVVPALLYIAMSVFSVYVTVHSQLSYFGLFLKIHAFLMFIYFVNHVRTWDTLRLIFTTAAICLLFEGILMTIQYLTGFSLDFGGLVTSDALGEGSGAGVVGSRVAGTLSRPGTAALYLNSMLAITIGAYLIEDLVDRRLALAAIAFGLIALVGTASRGGWASFAAALMIITVQSLRTEVGRRNIPIFIIGGVLVSMFLGSQIVSRFSTVTEDTTREELAFMAYNILEDYPLGVGDNAYDQVMDDKYAHPEWVGHTLYPPHSKYVTIQAEMGPQGLAAFMLIVIGVIWLMGRWLLTPNVPPHLTILAASVLGALTANFIHMRSETFTGRPPVQLFWFLLALAGIIDYFIRQARQEEGASSSEPIKNSHLISRAADV